MPRTPRFKVAAIAELFRQLEYAPPETRARQMDATERLIADVDPRQNYPDDFITFRITGYRSDRADEPSTLVGEALLPDLVNFVLLLSKSLRLPMNHARRQALSLDQISAQLGVSSKSVQRYRRRGLVFHYAQTDSGKPRLICFEDALRRFLESDRQTAESGTGYSRMNGEVEAAIVAKAAHLQRTEHLSLNQAAQRLADEHDRSHETVRQLLRRHDHRSKSPIFRDAAPLTDDQIHLVYRAWHFGMEPDEVARRLGKSKATIHRAVNRRRAELLARLDLSFVHLPTFDLPDASQVILSAPAVCTGLEAAFAEKRNIVEWIRSLPKAASKPDRTIDTMLAGYNFLKMRAGEGLKALGKSPSSEMLDEIETSLRWAALLKQLLLMQSIPIALRRIEQHLHQPLARQSPAFLVQALGEAMRLSSRTIDRVDPGRDQELDRMVSQAMDRSLARKPMTEPATGALIDPMSASMSLSSSLGNAVPWSWICIPSHWRTRTSSLLGDQSLGQLAVQAVTRRHGWDGGPPHTVSAVAEELKITPIGAVRLLRRAEVHLRRHS